jgi:tetratricopeptide (TPR) repeat protein/GGDEF domain-containing protein
MPEINQRPDRAEITKLTEHAEKLLQKGKTADALDSYQRILKLDPGNDVQQMAADLCLSLQRIPEAVSLLGETFERQIQAGDATRASLTYKKLARYAKPTWEQRVRFGQILEGSNRKLATETYESVLEELMKHEDKASSLDVLRRIVALDPGERNLLRLGELSSQAGDKQSAATAFLKLGQLAEAGGSEASTYFERAYKENSADPEIAIAYGRSLLAQGQAGAAIFVFEPHLNSESPPQELRENYGKALLAAGRLAEAEPFVWELFEQNPSRLREVSNLIGLFIDAHQDSQAVELSRKLEQVQRRRGDRKGFAGMMQDLVSSHRASPELLEFMGEVFNSSNRESDYSQTLSKLFDLYCGLGDFTKAADCLDRAAEVDAYEPGHQKRLELLHGKIDENRYKVIASRFSSLGKSSPGPAQSGEPVIGAAALQDLILQAEILVQYGMKAKAFERLQRIQELFPHEEDRNEDLQRLYMAAGLNPRYAEPPRAAVKIASAPEAAPLAKTADSPDVSSFTRVSEISRKLNRQATADFVMSVAVREIGTHWNASRCIIALRKPGLASSAITEYCGPGVPAGQQRVLETIVGAAQDLVVQRGALLLPNLEAADELATCPEAVTELAVSSLLALPLNDGKDQMGVLLLSQSVPRAWHSNDVMVLRAICEQVVIALHNAGLRRLVRNLSVTDESSGLLKRASYLDLLLAETQRAWQQKTPLTVVLMQFGRSAAMLKEFGETAVEGLMQQIGLICSSHIRQNDLAFRYDTTSVALVLGSAGEREAAIAADHLRQLIAEMRMPGTQQSVPFDGGLAEAAVRTEFDPVDIVTEVINRVEQARDAAIAQGANKVVSRAAALTTAAVA